MASHKVYRDNEFGFTLIEMIVVIAILGFILSLGLFLSLDSYRGYVFRSERSVLVSALERARSRAGSNLFESPHGLCFVASNYIIFRGSICDPADSNNEFIPSSPSISVSGLLPTSPVVFEQLTGRLLPQLSPITAEYTITLTQGSRSATVSLNNEGRIEW